MVSERLQPQPLCQFVNQLDTAGRFMWNEVTSAKSTVVPSSIRINRGGIVMIYVGIDVAKDKHDCYIVSSEGEIIAEMFTIPNNMKGFDLLLDRIKSAPEELDKVKVGLEATGHYSYNILGYGCDDSCRDWRLYHVCFTRQNPGICWTFAIHIPVGAVDVILCPDGEARFALSPLCAL